jgi:RNA polymerase sigma factor (sigma-70 family)
MATPPHSQAGANARAQALVHLLEAHHPRLIAQARRHCRRSQDADDALGDACVQFLRFYDGPPGTDALHWLLLVTKRCAWALNSGRIPESLDTIEIEDSTSPAEIVVRAEETKQIIREMELLRPDQRVALILLGLGCSHTEIRQIRGWSLRKVRRCLADGRRRVRKMLEGGDN